MEPSSPDQAAFHEGFSDVVALLSVFALPDVVRALLDRALDTAARPRPFDRERMSAADVSRDRLANSVLLGLAKQFGREAAFMGRSIGQSALRHSVELRPSPKYLWQPFYQEAHTRGEILVAAMMNAFLSVWADRLSALVRDPRAKVVDRTRAAEEGSRVADYLLTMAIRAIDYCPPVHLTFGTFLSAALTADHEIRPDDSYGFRKHLLHEFQAFGISPASKTNAEWAHPEQSFRYGRTRFQSMQQDTDEVFRFAWENRDLDRLRLCADAYTRVISVRPCRRVAPEDGFMLHETVAEILQQLMITASELKRYGIKAPPGMPAGTEVMLLGGVTLVFDEYGQVKYAIGDTVFDEQRPEVQQKQTERLASLWERGFFRKGTAARRFASIHRQRALEAVTMANEAW
jgi:hypothetical protein